MLVLLSISPVWILPAGAETWKLTSLDWQPYAGTEMANQGNSIQKLRILLEKQGITLVVEYYPWKRAQFLARKPEYVGYFPAWPEEVAEDFVASPPIDWSVLGYIKEKHSRVEFNTVQELFKNYTVGIVFTYVYPQAVQKAMTAYPEHTDKSPDEVSLLRKLSLGRFQVALTDPKVMMYLAEKEKISNIEPMTKRLEKKPLVIAFRKGADNQKRITLLESVLK
ncbi:MAG: hypothetical protein HUK40_06665 [Desulfobacter sp.]|nr:hypothetical protein [Desulfobacter sp.]